MKFPLMLILIVLVVCTTWILLSNKFEWVGNKINKIINRFIEGEKNDEQ
ncbi:hypothetical protein [Brevibacillus laterosporus]|nr:hypothetical protein [Brevibacillus laterosporus]MED1667280.1 hypothetical protein [Brevibacillus laterosporus]MED1718259.1 hypothetical protein [Brevibacillus laterosporus]